MKPMFTVLLVGAWLALWILGGRLAWSSYRFLKQARVVPGKVVDIQRVTMSRNPNSVSQRGGQPQGGQMVSGSTFPVIEFTAENGETHHFTGNIAESHLPEPLEVLYLPHRPDEARIKSFADLWIKPIVAGIGGLIALLGILFYRQFF